jgi:hypothetical protein
MLTVPWLDFIRIVIQHALDQEAPNKDGKNWLFANMIVPKNAMQALPIGFANLLTNRFDRDYMDELALNGDIDVC